MIRRPGRCQLRIAIAILERAEWISPVSLGIGRHALKEAARRSGMVLGMNMGVPCYFPNGQARDWAFAVCTREHLYARPNKPKYMKRYKRTA
jgi:hypothetical protein